MLDIHLEKIDDNGEKLKKIAKAGKPFILSIPPILLMPEHESFKNGIYPEDYFFSNAFVKLLRQIVKKPGVVLGQQGYFHYHGKCYERFLRNNKRWPDPWHENFCLYENPISLEEQRKFMEKGREIIEKTLGVSPKLFVPPNHLYDGNTILAAEQLGFKYFSDRDLTGLKPYKNNSLIILPERKLDDDSEFVYIHYDEINNNNFKKILGVINSSKHLDKTMIILPTPNEILENERLKLKRKLKRDEDKR